MASLGTRYHNILDRISQACNKAHRNPGDVKLLAVSKTKPAHMVEECYAEGQRHFGENYLQDAQQKIPTCTHLEGIQWHFIGPVQSNKTRTIAELFDWCETIDRPKIVQRLNDQRPAGKAPLNVLIQVNISGEEQKSGVTPDDILPLANLIAVCPNLNLRGLMCIPSASDNNQIITEFENMNQLFVKLKNELSCKGDQIDTLSMGMSQDLELAIAAGSTEVRIGTDIFGSRDSTSSEMT